MKLQNCMLAFSGVVALIAAIPVAGQVPFLPDYALPSAGDAPSTYLAATYGRGLNDASTKSNAFALTLGRTADRVSFRGSAGRIESGLNEWALGGSVGVDLISKADAPVQLTLQGGVGWMAIDVLGETLTNLRFPIGIAIKGRPSGSSVQLTPWVMPRLNIARASIGGVSGTSTDLGVSGGVGITAPGGFGIHLAADVLAVGDNPFMFSVGSHYVIGR
jgi:hypothetical protein